MGVTGILACRGTTHLFHGLDFRYIFIYNKWGQFIYDKGSRKVFKIGICDDEDILINELQGHLERYADETGREFCFFHYHDGSELVEKYNGEYDLIFMDIKMEKLNGLKTAEAIRKIDSAVGLIFLTSLKQYVWKGYEYGAVNYLLKPVKYRVLKMELDRYFAHYQGKEELYLSFSNDSGKYKVLYKDLRYGETDKRNVMVHFEGQAQVIYKNMKEIASLLCSQPQFAQCHQSFIVNLSYVKGVEGLELVLTTGERIPISQPKRKGFMMKLTDYWGDML
ncbi:MAG: response regulator transcription factor [Firmicutes bacterium]|jgi:DNA-binding LytR/AlgR family response regulator|nr:response regulator transcription factor [Bacillota bacterium]